MWKELLVWGEEMGLDVFLRGQWDSGGAVGCGSDVGAGQWTGGVSEAERGPEAGFKQRFFVGEEMGLGRFVVGCWKSGDAGGMVKGGGCRSGTEVGHRTARG